MRAKADGNEELEEALEYASRFWRADLIAEGMPAALADAVLAAAAEQPGADPTFEPVPEA
jgi:hypothetical protein